MFGKLYTEHSEIVAEGNCQVDLERGSVTMRPIVDTPLLSRPQANLHLELEDGTSLAIRGQIIRFRLNAPGVPPGPAYRMSVIGGSDSDRLRAANGEVL